LAGKAAAAWLLGGDGGGDVCCWCSCLAWLLGGNGDGDVLPAWMLDGMAAAAWLLGGDGDKDVLPAWMLAGKATGMFCRRGCLAGMAAGMCCRRGCLAWLGGGVAPGGVVVVTALCLRAWAAWRAWGAWVCVLHAAWVLWCEIRRGIRRAGAGLCGEGVWAGSACVGGVGVRLWWWCCCRGFVACGVLLRACVRGCCFVEREFFLVALLDRGADPTQQAKGETPIMTQAFYDRVDNVAHLLQDPRVRDTTNAQEDMHGLTALRGTETTSTSLLLQAGANPAIPDTDEGETLLTWLRRERPNHQAIVLLEQYPVAKKDTERASHLSRPAAWSPSNGTPRHRLICKVGPCEANPCHA